MNEKRKDNNLTFAFVTIFAITLLIFTATYIFYTPNINETGKTGIQNPDGTIIISNIYYNTGLKGCMIKITCDVYEYHEPHPRNENGNIYYIDDPIPADLYHETKVIYLHSKEVQEVQFITKQLPLQTKVSFDMRIEYI